MYMFGKDKVDFILKLEKKTKVYIGMMHFNHCCFGRDRSFSIEKTLNL